MRAVIYARYSSDLQSEASIEDQIAHLRKADRTRRLDSPEHVYRSCPERRLAPSSRISKLLEDARAAAFDVVISEALDRLSRDQEDVAALYKHLTFAGVKLVTAAEGEINELHVGLKGTMNALFLKDLRSQDPSRPRRPCAAGPVWWRPLLWLRSGAGARCRRDAHPRRSTDRSDRGRCRTARFRGIRFGPVPKGDRT